MAELDDTKRNMSYRTDEASAPATANAVLYALASHDGGQTWDPAGKIEGVYYDWRVPQLSLPALAVDRTRGQFRGQLYAVWPDARQDHRTRILFSSSRDHGRTRTSPVVIDDDGAGRSANGHVNNFMPAIAVNGRGVVGVSCMTAEMPRITSATV
ncbi:MAG: exo-alpha-sialidase [Acidobacteria bacterium Pan2503]|uniref:Exo-alpha-sialidase n=1 Tax=Candidatus Acidiferrum panamense TaxID=2741543 RepID=A0A7V8SVC8_9BACT|nr:exo-alpha-sialidase [Candidatus Acidoferrum panamensis]